MEPIMDKTLKWNQLWTSEQQIIFVGLMICRTSGLSKE